MGRSEYADICFVELTYSIASRKHDLDIFRCLCRVAFLLSRVDSLLKQNQRVQYGIAGNNVQRGKINALCAHCIKYTLKRDRLEMQ